MQSKSSIPIFTVLYAILTSSLVLGLFTYWFAFANRAIIFLYDHDMGSFVPDTTPFSRVTSSRYWMAGLVAAGAVLILYTAVNWLLGCWRSDYRPPPWWQIWAFSALLIVPGILLLTTSVNEPTLPLRLVIWVTAVTLTGLIFALLPGEIAARQPATLLWLTADGLGMAFVFLF